MKKFLITSIFLAISASPLMAQEETPDYPRIIVETSAGTFVMELFTAKAPLTVKNFLAYLDSGFYNGTIFHRVVGNFVAQAGGYDTDYKLKPTRESVPNESGNGMSNRRGYVAMARTSAPHSADSQFYINLGDNLALDPRPTRWGYTVFGRVVEGMEVIDEIGYGATGPGPVPELSKDVPAKQVVIINMALADAASESPVP